MKVVLTAEENAPLSGCLSLMPMVNVDKNLCAMKTTDAMRKKRIKMNQNVDLSPAVLPEILQYVLLLLSGTLITAETIFAGLQHIVVVSKSNTA